MEKPRQRISFGLMFLLISSVLAAQEPTEPKYPRFDVTPLLGYRTPMSFSIEPALQGTSPKVVIDAAAGYGCAFGVRFHDTEDVVEFRWTRQQSHTHLQDVSVMSSVQRVTLDQFHGDFTHEYIMEGWPVWARPFIIGSVGATHVAGSGNTEFTRFSFGIGGGVKLFFGKHFGFRTQAEWLPVVVSSQATVFCGGGCLVHIGGTLGSQGEVTAGPLLRF